MYINIKLNMRNLSIFIMAGLMIMSIILLPTTNAGTVQTNAKVQGIEVPIIMYHSVLKDENLQGKYVIAPYELESDLKYLTRHGYTTIVMQDLIDYVYNGKPLPDKPIILTFDDGYYNNYSYAFELMKKYNCKMVISIIGYCTDKFSEANEENVTYGNVTWNNLKDMLSSGLVEVQNHTYNMHETTGRKGIEKKSNETYDEYKQVVTEDIKKLQDKIKEKLNVVPNTFVYPFGAESDCSKQLLIDMGFKSTITCESRVNLITRDKSSLYELGRFIREHEQSTEDLFSKIVSANPNAA